MRTYEIRRSPNVLSVGDVFTDRYGFRWRVTIVAPWITAVVA